jgi:hypothetical protein
MTRWLVPLVVVAALGATGCHVTVERDCTAGVRDGEFLSYPVARSSTFDFPTGEFGYAITVGGRSAAGADEWKLTFLDSTGVTNRQFSGYISSGGGFTVYSPFGGATAMPDPQDPGRFLVYGGLGSVQPAGVDFDALSYPVGIQAAVNQSYAAGRIYYRDGNTGVVCSIDGGQAAFSPEPL